MKRRVWGKLAAPLLSAALLAGCSIGFGGEERTEEPASLRVMFGDEQWFHQEYGMLFAALYPNIEVEVIPTNNIRPQTGENYQELMLDFIEEEKPDVMMLDANQYAKLAGEGKLLDLETRVNREEFDPEGLVPGVLDYLKEKGGGKLYGLTPNYYSSALYYNKDLFDKYGIAYPKDKMTWDELLVLAARFPTDGDKDNRVYGLRAGYQSTLTQLGTVIGQTQGLKFVDPATSSVMINSDAWKKVYETALKAIKSGSLYAEDPSAGMNRSFNTFEDYLLQDPFISGKVAMALEGPSLAGNIKQAAASSAKDKAVKNWDLVTVPVNPQNPDYGNGQSFYQIMAIDANTPNVDAAWTFLSYIHSEEFARVKSKTQNGNMPVRAKYFKDDEGRRFEAFYTLKPSPNDPFKDFDKLPQDFFMQWNGLAEAELKPAQDGKISIGEALDSLQTKAQAMLLEAKEKDGNVAPAESAGAVSSGGTASAGTDSAGSVAEAG